MRGATASTTPIWHGKRDFNPRSSCEERRYAIRHNDGFDDHFNPRSSCEERRGTSSYRWSRFDFNPRSSCEERLEEMREREQQDFISIHAPHARSDCRRPAIPGRSFISIHAPHARSDLSLQLSARLPLFQSTLLMRGATTKTKLARIAVTISIHAPHARSDVIALTSFISHFYISIHAPHARSD